MTETIEASPLPAISEGPAEVKPVPARDPITKRFLPGNNGGPGRPVGARTKLIEAFTKDFLQAWEEHGVEALQRVAKDDPTAFIRAACHIMPKDVLVEARGAGLIVVRMADEDHNL